MTEQQAAEGGALLMPEIPCCLRRMKGSVEVPVDSSFCENRGLVIFPGFGLHFSPIQVEVRTSKGRRFP